MKTLLFIIGLLFSISLFGQDDMQLQRDTARANRLFEEAESDSLSAKDLRVLELFEEATRLYEKHPFMIESMPTLVNYFAIHDLQNRNYEWTDSTGNAIIQKMETNGFSKYHPSLYRVYRKLANNASRNDNVKQTIFYWGEAAKAAKNTDDPLNDYCRAILLQAHRLLHFEASFDEAYPLLAEMDSIIKVNPNDVTNWSYRTYYFIKEDYYIRYTGEAEKAIIMAKKYMEYFNDRNDNHYAGHFIKLASGYAALNDKAQMLENINKGLTHLENMRVDTTEKYGLRRILYLYIQISEVFYQIKDFEKSIEYGEKVLEAYANVEDKNSLDGSFQGILSWAHQRLAMAYLSLDKFDKSIEMIKYCLDYDSVGTHYLVVYAETLLLKEDYDKAIEIAQQAIQTSTPDFQPTSVYEHPSFTKGEFMNIEWALFTKSAALYEKAVTGNNINYEILAHAIESCQRYLEGIDVRSANYFRTSELSLFDKNESRGKYAKYLIDAYYHYYQKDKNQTYLEKMLYYAEYYKGPTIIEALYKGNFSEEDLEKEAHYLQQIRLLEQNLDLADDNKQANFQNELFAVTDAYEYFKFQLKKKYPISSEDTRKATFVNSVDIQANLEMEEALISYVQVEESLFIFLFAKNNFDIKKVLLPANFSNTITELTKIIKHPLNLMNDKREKFIQQSNELYEVLMKPIETQLADIQQLTIIPDDELFYLPFEILLKSDDNKPYQELDYLIEDFAISYNYSASIHTQKQQQEKDLRDFSFLGFAPVFEGGQAVASRQLRSLNITVDSLQRSLNGNAFVYLPNTKKELTEIEKILPPNNKTTILLEQQATKKAVINLLEKPYHFLHFATHGIVNPKKNKYSSLITYTEEANSLDRFLFVNEIQTKAIQADLVVLSSCESGVGDLATGEGLIALNRGFIYSGANNVLFTLWKINDKYSSDLMIDFYKNYLESGNYAKALQAAKVNFLQSERTANPRYWGAFQLIGE